MLNTDFKHPLARDGKVWETGRFSTEEKSVLVVITTLVLDAKSSKFKKEKVERLAAAAQEWLSETKAADGFVLVNRPKDWN